MSAVFPKDGCRLPASGEFAMIRAPVAPNANSTTPAERFSAERTAERLKVKSVF